MKTKNHYHRSFLLCLFTVLFSFLPVSGDYVIHVMNPWADSDSIARRDTLWITNEFNYHPGTKMVNEGGGWFYYIYKTPLTKNSNHSFNLRSYIPSIYSPTAGTLIYPASGALYVDSLFAKFSSQTTEVWIYTDGKKMEVLNCPKKGKIIHLFSPWPDNSPQIIVGPKGNPLHMIMRSDLCGWYDYYFAAPYDSLGSVQFTDYFHTQRYTSDGLKTGTTGMTPIDLRPYFATEDTLYILPQPFPVGAPVFSTKFPGKTGECGVRQISAIFRDWKLDEKSFFNNPTGMNGGGADGMVQNKLTAPDYKPKITTDKSVSVQYAESLNTWFKTITFPDGKDNDTCIDLTLTKGDDGRWTFDSDKMGGFFPLDSFNDANNIKYYDRIDPKDPRGRMRNFHFTMEMHMSFAYHKGAGLNFDFRGDDDVWIFINNTLAIDLGGLHEWASGSLDLDRDATKLGLTDGEVYSMDIFYCERNPVSSNLLIRTSMDLHNSDELYYKEKKLGAGKIQYDIWQRLKIEGPDCGFTPLLNAETLATVKFMLDGPGVIAEELKPGPHYGGITVDASQSRVTLDSAKIDGLTPGEYRITYVSSFDAQRKGYLIFVVPAFPPDHLDIVPAAAVFDLVLDQKEDSLFMDVDLDEIQVFAVIRDKNGFFIDYAANQTWISGDTSVFTIAQSTADKLRYVITKTGTGETWLVVKDPKGKLKPDSVKIRTIYKPKFPSFISAVMLDTNGDIVPDMISMTLSDTVKSDQRLDSVMISYRGKVYSVAAGQFALSGKTLLAPFAAATGTDGRPTGQVTLVGTVAGEVSRRSKEATDGVGPALVAAQIQENESQGPDTLYLTFSEPVLISSVFGKQLILKRTATGDSILLDVNATVSTINDSTFGVAITLVSPRPLPGDSLRLVPGKEGGTVADPVKNTPHLLNRAVVLGLRVGATSVSGAYYLDANADGFIDKIVMVFKRSVAAADFKSIKVHWSTAANTKSETVGQDALTKISDSVWTVAVHGERLSDAPQTSGPMEVLVEYVAFPGIPRSSHVADSAAAVIVSATFSYGTAAALDSSLSVIFSEPLRDAPGSHPFFLWSKRYGAHYGFTLAPVSSPSGATYNFVVISFDPGKVTFAGQNDSIWIDVSAAVVVDMNGNKQTNPLNHRALLTVTLPQPEWITTVSVNPFPPGTGTEISVQSKAPIIDPDRFTTELQIYDGVGNAVTAASMQPKNKGFAWTWNGYNKNARRVGSGIYPAFVRVSENGRVIWTNRIRIGVKR